MKENTTYRCLVDVSLQKQVDNRLDKCYPGMYFYEDIKLVVTEVGSKETEV